MELGDSFSSIHNHQTNMPIHPHLKKKKKKKKNHNYK